MNVIALEGCRTDTLGSYLQGLGVWNAVVRILDPAARAAWRGGRLVLTTELTGNQLLAGLLEHFEPLPVVSPWNGGSGFSGNGKSREAESLLARARGTDDPRWAALREAVEAGERIVALCREQGWAGSGSAMWAPDHKPKVIEVCRNELPDAALGWLDAAVAITTDSRGQRDLGFNRLLGTGGNFGRQDLQATYLSRAVAVQLDPKTSRSSKGWLNAVLFAEEGTAYLRETVGQFDPGRAGGIMTSPGETSDDKGFANPWQYLFMIEGALMFASAVVRRHSGGGSGAALPFMVWPSRVGYGTSAPAENVMAEFWAPQWDRPAALAEIQQVIGEARMQWRRGAARTGLDAARAVATKGVARGLTAFTRYVIAERLGQNPLATSVGTVKVEASWGADLLGDADVWLQRVQRVPDLPSSIADLARAVEECVFTAATDDDGGRGRFREVLVALGRLHQAVSRSSHVREQVEPLVLRRAAWWDVLGSDPDRAPAPDDVEARLARALASARDRNPSADPDSDPKPWRSWPLRSLVTPVTTMREGWRQSTSWDAASPAAPLGAGVAPALASAHRRRMALETVVDPYGGDPAATDAQEVLRTGTKGSFAAFSGGSPWPVDRHDVEALLRGNADEERLGDLLLGAVLIAPAQARPARTDTSVPAPSDSAQVDVDGADDGYSSDVLVVDDDGGDADVDPGVEAVDKEADAGDGRSSAGATPDVALLPMPVGLALLLPFFGVHPLSDPRGARGRASASWSPAAPLLLRPQPTWIPRLIAGRLTEVLTEAAWWLSYVGVTGLPDPAVAAASLPRLHPCEADASVGERLAAVLLVPVGPATRWRALRLVGDAPQPDTDLSAPRTAEGASA